MKVLALTIMVSLAAPAVAATDDAAAPKKERVICKRDEKTASRMNATRICRTATQWKEYGKSSAAIEEAADKLETVGQKISTGDLGGMQSGDTPH